MEKTSPTQRLRAVALVLSGCSVNGVATYCGVQPSTIRGFMTTRVTRDEITACGGNDAFVARYLFEPAKAQIEARTAWGQKGGGGRAFSGSERLRKL